jgi:predicted protein tyrosine phosphatase
MRILFVCTGNVDRSKTAEDLFKDVEGWEVRSAGTGATAAVQLSRELIGWADKVFVMEDAHKKAIRALDPAAEMKIACLNIPDLYVRGEPELRQLLKERLRPYLDIG